MTVGVDRNRFGGAVRFERDGDRTNVSGSILLRPRRYRDHHGHNRGRGYFGYGDGYATTYPYAATYPYRYPYRPDYENNHAHWPQRRYAYPWRFGHDSRWRRDHHHHWGSGRTYYPSCGYWPYSHSYVSVYYDAPVVYRNHDVYTYHDADIGSPVDYEVSTYASPDAGVDYDASRSLEYAGSSSYYDDDPGDALGDVPIEWTYDPPDGVGPPLDWAGERTPLPGEPTAVGDGLRAFRENDFDAARNAFVRGVLLDERDAYAKFLYGLASFAQRDYAVAAVSFRRAALADELFVNRPPDVRVLYDDAHVFESQLDELSRVAVNRLDDGELRFLLAYLFYATGEPRIASELFLRLAQFDPADDLAKALAKSSAEASLRWDPEDVAAGGR